MRTSFVVVGALALGLGLGLYIGSPSSVSPVSGGFTIAPSATVWTCSMHPQVRLPGPGPCPICSMPLVPASAQESGATTATLRLGEAARSAAGIETAPVRRRRVSREIRAVGKVQYNETALSTITSRVNGYIERLFVDYTGIEIQKNDHLVEIYSPDLVVAQNELLVASAGRTDTGLAEATRKRLLLAGLTPEQIADTQRSRKIKDRVTLYSPVRGTVVEKLVVEKSAVKDGDVLYRLADLESVWLLLDLYEYEVAWVQPGLLVKIRTEVYPGREFAGRVIFVSPIVQEETRTIRVRVNVGNHDRRLKPGMFASAVIRAPILSSGLPAPTGLEGQFVCPMHPEVLRAGPAHCPICGMALEQLSVAQRPPAGPPGADEESLVIPASALLDGGLRKLVFVEDAPGRYRPVEVVVGPRTEDEYPVFSGLRGTERVVSRGAFLLDSEAQIRELPSLFKTSSAAHHGPATVPHPAGPSAEHSRHTR